MKKVTASFATNLRHARLRCGYTQEAIAKELHIDRTTYTKYESGVSEPSFATLCSICALLSCSADSLLGIPS